MIRTIAAAIAALALSTAPAWSQTDLSSDPAAAPAGVYKLDPANTSVTLKVSHMGLSYFTFRLDGVSGSYDYDPAHPEATRLDIGLDANSVDTGDPAFSRQIAGQVFDAAKYPQVRFVSTAVRPGSEGRGTVTGALTFHGVTKPVTLDVILNGAGHDGARRERMGYSAVAQIRRSDFGATAYAPMVGDEVSVAIEAEFVKDDAKP